MTGSFPSLPSGRVGNQCLHPARFVGRNAVYLINQVVHHFVQLVIRRCRNLDVVVSIVLVFHLERFQAVGFDHRAGLVVFPAARTLWL